MSVPLQILYILSKFFIYVFLSTSGFRCPDRSKSANFRCSGKKYASVRFTRHQTHEFSVYVVHTSKSTQDAKFTDRFANIWYTGATGLICCWVSQTRWTSRKLAEPWQQLGLFALALHARSATFDSITGQCQIGILVYGMSMRTM